MPLRQYHPLKVVSIIAETTEAASFVLEPVGWEPVYEAGQFMTLVFETAHGEKRRSFSIASSPLLKEPLTITVKRVSNGEFSRFLLSHVKAGDFFYCSNINGQFVLPAAPAAIGEYFFFAAGSGITPCFSLIKTLLATTSSVLYLFYSNRHPDDIIFKEQLAALQQQYPQRFHLKHLLSSSNNVYEGRLSNWLLQQLLAQHQPAVLSNALFYCCGPFGYMQMIGITLLSAGIPKAHIYREIFNVMPLAVKPVPPDTDVHAVHFNSAGRMLTTTVQYPETILAAARRNALPIHFSCEAGICGSCAATCTKGTVWMAYNEVLLDEEIAAGRILCCQAYPIGGDVEIKLDI